MSKMIPTSIRLTESELTALQEGALQRGIPVSALIKAAAVGLAQKLGADPRPKDTYTYIKVQLDEAHIEALRVYQAANENPSLGAAARYAVISRLQNVGLLPEHTLTDYYAAVNVPLRHPKE